MKGIRVIIIVLLVICCGRPARASFRDAFGGFVDLARVHAEVDDKRQDTLRREIKGNFTRDLAPYLNLVLGLRYYKYNQDLDLSLGSYREEIQPTGELRWNHPLFQFSTAAMRRRVTTSSEAAIITDDFLYSLQSQDAAYPLVKIGYEDQHTFYPDDPAARDIRNRRFQIGADYSRRRNTLSYNFSRQRSENLVSGLKSLNLRHLLRWSGQYGGGKSDRLSLSGSLTSQYLDQLDEVPGGGTVLELIAARKGLYALDDGPDLDPLEEVPGLVDGITDEPTDPAIDIGGAAVNTNLGVDLGAPVPVSGLYIYTDRPSGRQVSWTVYVSEDNLTWEVWDRLPVQVFNQALNRYEISFVTSYQRYVKVVNAGLNEVAQVFVTEVEVLRERPAMAREKRLTFINLMDSRVGYQLSEKWHTSLDLSLQHSELMGRQGDRTLGGAGWRLDYVPSQVFGHHLRVEYSGQQGNGDEATQNDRSVGYSLVFRPLNAWRGALSVNDRRSTLEGKDAQDIRGVSFENTMALLPGLDFRLGSGVTRTDDHLGGVRIDTWNSRFGFDTEPRSDLKVSLDGSYQESTGGVAGDTRVRRTGNVAVDWRPGTLFHVRGNVQGVSENTDSVIRDILLGWNIFPGIRLSGQAYALRTGGVTTSKRWSVNMNVDLNSRSYLYLRFAEVDLTGGGGARTVSFQQGFRAGF